jgi:hypothetical protein
MRFASNRFLKGMLLAVIAGASASSLSAAEPDTSGVVRIRKAKPATTEAVSSSVVIRGQNCNDSPTSLIPMMSDASDNISDFYEATYGQSGGDWRTAQHTPGSLRYRTQQASLLRAHRTNNFTGYMVDGHCPDGSPYPGHHFGLKQYLACKFGYFIPTGNGGAGTPIMGKYARVYPQDPNYFDQRDGQIYGAQGYGVPMAVPLAPVVGHTYNYGWGLPSSRLTPVSRVAY